MRKDLAVHFGRLMTNVNSCSAGFTQVATHMTYTGFVRASALNAALADAAMKAKLKELGGAGLGGTPSEFAAFVGGEIEKWGKVVKFSGAKPR